MQTSARKLTRDKQINIRATDGGGLENGKYPTLSLFTCRACMR